MEVVVVVVGVNTKKKQRAAQVRFKRKKNKNKIKLVISPLNTCWRWPLWLIHKSYKVILPKCSTMAPEEVEAPVVYLEGRSVWPLFK